jgi:twitching motility two-component system response regulator PilH
VEKRILIVDDEPDVVKYLSSLLADNGFVPLSAADGKTGMAAAEKERPDLICMDINMPNESGPRMLRHLKENPATSKIPVVIVTGVDSKYRDFLAKRKQVTPPAAYFEKPIDKELFISEIRRVLAAA